MKAKFVPEPVVILANYFQEPHNLAVATARTCYAPRVIAPEEVAKDDQARAVRDRIAESTYQAGHHTTIQHPTFQFILDRVSRQFIWSFLHAHPFYNCLAGETEIPHFHASNKAPWTVAELYQRFRSSDKHMYVKKMHVRSVDHAGNLVPNRIKDVVATGRQTVFKVTTRLGYVIRATQAHRFMGQDRAWVRLHELSVGDKILVNGVRVYKDRDWLKQRYHDEGLSHRAIAVLAHTSSDTIRAWVRRHKLQKPIGSWSRGVPPHNRGRTKDTYEPLQRVSAWAKATGHQPPRNGRGSANSHWKGQAVKNPRERARWWYRADVCEVCGATKTDRRIERHHINKDTYDNSRENIIILCSLCHKAAESPHRTIMRVTVDRIVSIEPDGETETYDLVMEAPFHNFVANGFVVHNSEQVSQRYVEVTPEHFTTPPLDDRARAVYVETIQVQMAAYHRLIALVEPTVEREYRRLFPHRSLEEKRWRGAIKKRCQEVARYALPVATQAHLYHTISGLTLHRYHRLCREFDTPLEQELVVTKMVEAVNAIDPNFFKRIEDPLPLEATPEYELLHRFNGAPSQPLQRAFLDEFDRSLGDRTSLLIDYNLHGASTMAQAVRTVLGLPAAQLSDAEALDWVLNPARNRLFAEALNLTTMGKLTRTMAHPHFTFRKRLSHTADSQDQRHRMTPASRPVLARHMLLDRPDYIVPVLIQETPAALEAYDAVMAQTWEGMRRLHALGVPQEFVLYLLPNAFPIRFEESGDLLNLHHKWTKRLCYTAQEEIWNACREEVLQVQQIFPQLTTYLRAPCALRRQAGAKPICPEGDRFCGVAVWKQPLEAYDRLI